MTRAFAIRLTAAAICAGALGAMVPASSPTQPLPSPYWVGDFRSGDYCQYATIFQSSTVTPGLGPGGYVVACPHYKSFARDPKQRVYLTKHPPPPAQAASKWVSHQELRTTDGPWFPGLPNLDKSTIRLTKEQTLDGPFEMGMTRWFRVSLYLPEPGFNWPASSWYTLLDLHNSVHDPDGNNWATLSLIVVSYGKRTYLAFDLDGIRAGTNKEVLRLLQLTTVNGTRVDRPMKRPGRNRKGSKLPQAFNRWHTVVFGARFSDQGRIGNSPGWVKIYFDGKLVYDKARPNVWANETNVWLQLQNYKEHNAALVDGATSSTIYFADARIGRTRASVTR